MNFFHYIFRLLTTLIFGDMEVVLISGRKNPASFLQNYVIGGKPLLHDLSLAKILIHVVVGTSGLEEVSKSPNNSQIIER